MYNAGKAEDTLAKSAKDLRLQFLKFARHPKPTGDADCTDHICLAKGLRWTIENETICGDLDAERDTEDVDFAGCRDLQLNIETEDQGTDYADVDSRRIIRRTSGDRP
ncbi:hypothetical protein PsorP6_015500 [Peronosclerospora sorghi]|uniref:Uncharacterized protein n=1 Tax=Peronosclerospora sorghi TaxID=230839 RepID=A0ACC0WMR3_9STRA|nr:hypothetical protein PsorP6_015500 [Peronosclerospora sorghi]